MVTVRLLKDEEKALLTALIAGKSQAAQLLGSLASVLVEEVNDGGMGSLHFSNSNARPCRLGEQLVEQEFLDSDGIPVMVAINLDEHGELYELDIWKVDFSPLRRFPTVAK